MSESVIGERSHFTLFGTALMRARIVHMPRPEEYLPARRTDIYPGHVPVLLKKIKRIPQDADGGGDTWPKKVQLVHFSTSRPLLIPLLQVTFSFLES
ncbi:hypothetical protein NPIL_544181 [Nephila pilipes]|uniref:Uncharacterized protein n=1 Tax=Nephila pilipes TaxID=299642 RepID=A0A8X6PJD3_NEPPI|nr:hypothetical protein NPIL_544181 [Nephila pilipes]